MIPRRVWVLFCTIALLAAGTMVTPASAAVPPSESPTARANAGTVGVISGGVDGTYIRIAADLASVLDDGDQLRVLPVIGKGSLQNISDILYLKGIDIGIVQADALAYAKRQQLYPGFERSIQYIAKLYDEEVHILARKDVSRLEDLAGQKVNVDVRGSGTAMTASVLFDSLGIAPELTNDDQGTALEKLKRGEITAVIYVTGKPARLFAGIGGDTGLHFLPIPMTKPLLDNYLPAEFSHTDYPMLVPDGENVETAAVGSVMAVFGWQPGTERYNKVARFVNAFFGKFQQFLQPPHHPKWKDVNLAAQVPGWTRFAPAQDWLQRQAQAAQTASAPQAGFNTFLTRVGGPIGNLTDAQKDQLFRQFLDWQQHQRPAP
ncbi:MAG TPA: TAXI family TRAP transporter solute-binding subunit [Acetobacteraceae bacterium]|nr:TAXI family TRAP transporter solute-binding subunit [Acetobacteraceae bacterium]